MIGTAALAPGFLEEAAARFGERRSSWRSTRVTGSVAVDGWTRHRSSRRGRARGAVRGAGVRRLLVTSTPRDGSLAGPDLALLSEMLPAGLPVIAAGGVVSLDDLRALRDLGCEGAIAGSALLAGRFTLPEAHAALAEG